MQILLITKIQKIPWYNQECNFSIIITNFILGGEFLRAVGATSVPLPDLLPCAIETAFPAPLPEPGTKSDTPVSNVGERASKKLASSPLGMAAAVIGNQSLLGIRNAARPPAVGAISRSKDKLDIMVVRTDGSGVTAAWQPGDHNWRGWWQLS